MIQVGTERMTLGLEWSSQRAFRSQPLREWKVEGEVAGKTRSAGGLTFATIDAAGHMVRGRPVHMYDNTLTEILFRAGSV